MIRWPAGLPISTVWCRCRSFPTTATFHTCPARPAWTICGRWRWHVHLALRVAQKLSGDGIETAVLDLRSLAPLDREALIAVGRHCSKVLVLHEDSRTGGIGESLAAVLQEEAFEDLDAPVRILGALDTPVPYSPSLEDEFLPGEERIEKAARLLAAY